MRIISAAPNYYTYIKETAPELEAVLRKQLSMCKLALFIPDNQRTLGLRT
jgi:hypothetical protein